MTAPWDTIETSPRKGKFTVFFQGEEDTAEDITDEIYEEGETRSANPKRWFRLETWGAVPEDEITAWKPLNNQPEKV